MSKSPKLPSPERLLTVIEQMAGQPVLMCVDLVVDRFITGIPKRISREAPVLILEYESERFIPGGGANAVANVAALGGRALPLGLVGADETGKALLDELDSRGVPVEGILEIPGYRTPTKTRILGGGRHAIKQQIVRYDIEDYAQPDSAARAGWSHALNGWAAQQPRIAVLSDYGYGAVEPDLVPLLRDALSDPATILCDSRYRLSEFAGINGATPNEEEAEHLAATSLGDDFRHIDTIGADLQNALGTEFLLITRGSRGASLVLENGVAHLPVHGTDQVADVTGAGDTVIGTFALALAATASPIEAAILASYAGGVVVQKLGTATASPAELIHAVTSDSSVIENVKWDRF
ncbi:MAG: PfkB family carbohydrate kinase [Acidobacteriota bacterium]|nr:PfkB family carbohydrate kinase [Acidobacteriota bacterium]